MPPLTVSDSYAVRSNPQLGDLTLRELKSHLISSLKAVTSSGDFAICRQYQTFANPCLRIAGRAAVVPLPLTEHDAESVRGACREAPFGRGDETLVDTSVRKTWELDASHFQITNPAWTDFFATILNDVATGLGIPDVRARPHKLLLYEKGSFFKRHKDSEKEVGMIATLVVCLPAVHRGGAVHLSFGSEKREFATAPVSPFDITALAWFSDVDHEIKPLSFGHRLVLTYKLSQSRGVKQSAQLVHQQSGKVKSLLKTWVETFPAIPMLVYPLEHQYTKSSLSLKNMKGRDRAVCCTLQEASAECEVYLVLAHMTHKQNEDYDGDYGGGDKVTTLDTIYSCDGAHIASGHDLDESDILGVNVFKNRKPDGVDEGEFTGNESTSASFRYHNTVAVLIQKHQIHKYLKHYYSISGSRNEKAENLVSMVREDFEEHRDSPRIMLSTMRVMTAALDVCDGLGQLSMSCTVAKWALEVNNEKLYQRALKLALSSKEVPTELLGVVSDHLDRVFAKNSKDIDWEIWLGPFLENSTTLGGWHSASSKFRARVKSKTLQDSFSLWAKTQMDMRFSNQRSFTVDEHDFFLDKLSLLVVSDEIISAFALRGTRELICKVLDSMFQKREQFDEVAIQSVFLTILEKARSRLALRVSDLPVENVWINYHYAENPNSLDCLQFSRLVNQCVALGITSEAFQLIEECRKTLSANPTGDRSRVNGQKLVADLIGPLASTMHSCAITLTSDVKWVFEYLIRDVLHHKLPTFPTKLEGWRHKRRGCTDASCQDCATMNAFLGSADQKSWRFSASAPRRQHIESKLPHSLFMVQTVRNGSPLTLLVDKLGRDYAQDLQDFQEQLKSLLNVLGPLKGDSMRRILGDATYRELILLQKVRAVAEQSAAGTKRPSESDFGGDSVRQRR